MLAGIGIGLFTRASLGDELRHPDVMTILDTFLQEVRDVSVVWPARRFVPARVRKVSEFFEKEIPRRLRAPATGDGIVVGP